MNGKMISSITLSLNLQGSNTAPAIALTALQLMHRDPEAVMVVVPADHVVKAAKKIHAGCAICHEISGARSFGDIWHSSITTGNRIRLYSTKQA